MIQISPEEVLVDHSELSRQNAPVVHVAGASRRTVGARNGNGALRELPDF